MTQKMTLEQARNRAVDLMNRGYHWGPSVLQVMWEATDLGSEDLLWATIPFMGGIAGQRQAVCGAVSGASAYLGFRYRVPLKEKELADKARQFIREQARDFVLDFTSKHGSIICGELLGIDFSDAAAVQKFRDSGEWRRKCNGFVVATIEKLYQMEA